MAAAHLSIDALRACVGQELGVSDWFCVDQSRIDLFADVTDDHQFIHIDSMRAKSSPFGGIIAHGYLVLSLLSAMSLSGMPAIEGATMAINYGFDKIRFLTPVPSGAHVRARFMLQGIDNKDGGRWLLRLGVQIEMEGDERLAVIADWLTMVVL